MERWGDEDTHQSINLTDNASVEVVKPKFSIEKVSDNKKTNVGDIVSFTIKYTNTGKLDLKGVYIKDNEYSNGLKYKSFKNDGNWKFDGKDTWYYNGVLKPGESIDLVLYFIATTAGVHENTAVAGHNLTNDTLNSTADVTALENNESNPENETTVELNETIESSAPATKLVDINATGNPLFVLLLCLIGISFAPLRGKK